MLKSKKRYLLLSIALLSAGLLFAQQNWQKVTLPKYAEMATTFKNSPSQYAETLTYGLEGPLSLESISADLNAIKKQGIKVVTIEGGYHMKEPYLSAGWFENVKMIVQELKKRGMHLWIIDEGKYPSGFAGGKFSQERPDLRMQGLVIAKRINLKEEETVNEKLDASIISAVAVNAENKANEIISLNNHQLNWKAPQGNWQILLAQHRFKTSVTRAANNPTGGKDTVNSLCDYLNPAATRQFLEFTHVQYKKYIGDEFGKTVLGFRGDEPEYNFTPWTPELLNIFKQKKGYDITPYLASFFTPFMTEKQKLAKADFWDVWSDLFRDNFFKVQANWCAQNGLEYMVHINHEDKLMDLARSEGDYFKDMRYVQVPGVDAIWHQIWYDNVADFPKLASSAAHMYGKPRALSESFAAYTPKPTVADARWVVNEQLVRGINLFEYMFWPSSANGKAKGESYLTDPAFPALAEYSNRASFLLSNGIPAAQVGLYCPTESMWLGDEEANTSLLNIAKQLLEHQIDFDFVDNQALTSVFKLNKGSFTNLSGQSYRTIIIPETEIMSDQALKRLQDFAKQGGKVIFLGHQPEKKFDKTFLQAKPVELINWAVKEASGNLTDNIIQKISSPDVQLEHSVPAIKYLHRNWKDAEMYFFFNEGEQDQNLKVTLNGTGKAEIWDVNSGTIKPITSSAVNGKTQLQLVLPGHESQFIIIRSNRTSK
ncbi:glycosyl hydrolase [Mucilaginibacter arboris]|uniref:Beta-galactosidase n=1 Tax=Mucilaginibacter arboris TaxID=2682090 RepID=A0A7K1SVS9_9SPHI|nr:glycosyl hydrolase [Mucilaginibacter arboris]MVN21449.1 beta-galactosidase [Mucilaginibacter arboris]